MYAKHFLKKSLFTLFGLWAYAIHANTAPTGQIYTGEFGGSHYKYYLPAQYNPQKPLPLLMVLHGCKQNAAEMIKGTGFNGLADKEGFIVLYPETQATVKNPLGCWIWWDPDHQRRHQGEPKILVDLIVWLSRQIRIDTSRVYVTGISSGGAMSATLAALYPEMITAAAVHSGLAYGAAYSATCSIKALKKGGADAEGQGGLAYLHQGFLRRVIPVMVIQGLEDDVVDKINADHLIRQFAQTNDLADDSDGDNDSFDDKADDTDHIQEKNHYPYKIDYYEDANAAITMQKVMIENLGHAWSGGNPAGSYTDPDGPNASQMIWSFLKRWSINNPAPVKRSFSPCQEKFSANYWHFWGHKTMHFKEYLCDPWRATWRHGYDDVWGGGRCP